MNDYVIVRTVIGETEFYGPVFGAFYAPDWTSHVVNAQTYSNKRVALADAKALKHPGLRVVQVGRFGGVPNRVIRTVYTLE